MSEVLLRFSIFAHIVQPLRDAGVLVGNIWFIVTVVLGASTFIHWHLLLWKLMREIKPIQDRIEQNRTKCFWQV
jgi:hypothetical protein